MEKPGERTVCCRVIGVAALLLVLGGCVTPPQKPIGLKEGYFSTRTDRIGLAVSEIPQPDTSFPGADCLLCMAFASVSNSSLTAAVQKWTTEELLPLKGDLEALLKARGQTVVVIDTPLKMDAYPERSNAEEGFARRDFSALKTKSAIDRLLVVDIRALGAWRYYSSYVPTGAPRAVFLAEAYIVDLSTHKLDWYTNVDLARPAEGNWDEPPKFPGLTNSHFQIMEQGKDSIKNAFRK